MGWPRLTLSTSLVIAAIIAGCTSEPPVPSASPVDAVLPAEPATFTDTTGAIEGTVHDAELVPVVGASVADPDHGLAGQTDAAGRFTFSLLEPGTYTIFVSALGYESAGRSVDVVAGDVALFTLQLESIVIEEPYSVTFNQKGLLGCAVQVDPVTGFSACGIAGLVTLLTGQDTSNIDKFTVPFKVPIPTAAWNASVLEMHWRSTQAFGSGLQVIWEVNMCPGDGDLTFGTDVGKSPLRMEADEAKIQGIVAESSKPNNCQAQGLVAFDTSKECAADKCNMMTRVFAAAETTQQAADVGLAFQQAFEQYVTNFYLAAAPEGFSALPDA